jgi:tetratricopeptide (TPR) repeat protein
MASSPTAVGFRGSLTETPLPQVLRRIFLEGLKGTLSLVHGDETRHLFFEKGELRTATSSREGQRIGAFLKRRGWITDTDLNWALDTIAKQGRARLGKILVDRGLVSRTVLDAEMRRLVEEIVFSTFAWDTGEYRFQASSGVLDPDVALTLSTAAIIVEGIRRLPENDAFRERMGDGHRVPILATDPMSRYQYLPLTPQEAYLLSRIDGILDVDSLLKIAGASRLATAKILYALVSCGIVEWKQEGAERPVSGRGGFHGLNVEVAAAPTDRSPGHAELVKNTYRRIDWLSHYELLGVPRDAPPERVSEAYFERSRLFHPDLRHRDDLAKFEKELSAVFERMKTAYETLSDAEKRAVYDHGLDAAPASILAPESAVDPEMRKKQAAQNFRRARQLIEEKDYHPAVEMLREAVRFVPDNAEFRYVLSQVEMKNPNWIDQGLNNLKEAARLDSRRVGLSVEAARALLDHRRPHEAEPFARRAVSLDPSPENELLLQEVLDVVAAAPSRPSDHVLEPKPEAGEPESAPAPQKPSGLLSRFLRRRG